MAYKDYSYRIGERYTNRKGEVYEIVQYENKTHKCTVKFLDDNSVIDNLSYTSHVKLGSVSKTRLRSLKGKIFIVNNGSKIKVLKELIASKLLIETKNGTKICKKDSLLQGKVSERKEVGINRGCVDIPLSLVEDMLNSDLVDSKFKKELEKYC